MVSDNASIIKYNQLSSIIDYW